MSLTLGIGPFARPPGGDLNTELPSTVLFLHDVSKRVRGVVAGETVVDTERAKMLHETRLLPQWYLPLDDVRTDLLERSDTTTRCPHKGAASYWHLRVGDRLVRDALWAYEDPLPAASWLKGLGAFYYDRVDEWYEEDERLLGHPRDPFHRVDTRPTSRHVTVRVGDEVVAESDRAIALFETSLPVRYYLPPDDVRTDAFKPSETTTICPYKGVASYASVDGVEDAAWCYREPLGEALAVAGYWSFLGDGVEVTATSAR